MRTTVRIALLLTLTIATACRFVADKKDDAVRFLAGSILGSVAELQSATPLEQSSFRDAEPVAPRKPTPPASPVVSSPVVSSRASEGSRRASDAVLPPTLVSSRASEGPRRVREAIVLRRLVVITPCHMVVVPSKAESIGS